MNKNPLIKNFEKKVDKIRKEIIVIRHEGFTALPSCIKVIKKITRHCGLKIKKNAIIKIDIGFTFIVNLDKPFRKKDFVLIHAAIIDSKRDFECFKFMENIKRIPKIPFIVKNNHIYA